MPDDKDIEIEYPSWSDDIDEFLEESKGENPFNFESGCFIEMAAYESVY